MLYGPKRALIIERFIDQLVTTNSLWFYDFSFDIADADECLDPEKGPCVPVAHCQNEVPGYKCICPFGSTGDGKRHGSGCRKILQVIEAVLGMGKSTVSRTTRRNFSMLR